MMRNLVNAIHFILRVARHLQGFCLFEVFDGGGQALA